MSPHFAAIRAFRVAQIAYTAADSNDNCILESVKQSHFRLIKMVATAHISFQRNGQPAIKEFCLPFREKLNPSNHWVLLSNVIGLRLNWRCVQGRMIPTPTGGSLILDETYVSDDIPYPVNLRLLNVGESFSAGVVRETAELVINELCPLGSGKMSPLSFVYPGT